MNFKNWNYTSELQSEPLSQAHERTHLVFSHALQFCLLCLQNYSQTWGPAKQGQCLYCLALLTVVARNVVLLLLSPAPDSWVCPLDADSELRTSTTASG